MENNKFEKLRNKRNLLKLLQYRETRADAGRILKYSSQFTDSLIKRLGLEYELQGHQGCVNCLEWSADGRHLASGSDDTNVILWDPFTHKQLQVIPTNHIGNIFSVKFLGSHSNVIATAAADCRVLVQTMPDNGSKGAPILECSCHINRVKRLATSPSEPSLFWSAGEDGYLLQFDLREPHECNTSSPKVFADLTSVPACELKCVAVNPTKPHYLAIGLNDCYARIYDRRMIKLNSLERVTRGERRNDPPDYNCVDYYAPGHLAIENAKITNLRLAVTYIAFNSAGTELLVNIGSEQIYLFDINNKRHINELRIPQFSNSKRKFSSYRCKCRPEENGYVTDTTSNHDTLNDNCACFYMRRAYKCLRRNWLGDIYSAARDYLYVTQNWPDQRQAYLGLIKCLINLKWTNEVQQWIDYYCSLFPEYKNGSQVRCYYNLLGSLKKELSNTDKDVVLEHGVEYINKIRLAEANKRLNSYDYKQKFVGHCNTTTDIKEANFLGEDGNYICAGSDEGIIFIWERRHSSVVTALFGDISIVNCIQPHPSACFIASSGIDPGVKLWSPNPEDDRENPRQVTDLTTVVEANQRRLCLDPFESMLINMGYRIHGSGGSSGEPAFNVVPSCRTC